MTNMFSANLAGVKEGGKFLEPGIHNATFKGVIKSKYTNSKRQEEEECLGMSWDIEGYGEWTPMVFTPQSAERSENAFGGENPSEMEQYMIKLLHLLGTANPSIAEAITEGEIKLEASGLDDLIKKMQKWTNDFIGKQTQIKLLPGYKNFSGFPSFPAKINKSGQLYIGTKFIGSDLTLNANELKQIDKARNASPTDMRSTTAGAMKDAFTQDEEELDDLPF